MSIVILGGNECMERRYKDLCDSYQCQSKIFTKPSGPPQKNGEPRLNDFLHEHDVAQDGAGRNERAQGRQHCH